MISILFVSTKNVYCFLVLMVWKRIQVTGKETGHTGDISGTEIYH